MKKTLMIVFILLFSSAVTAGYDEDIIWLTRVEESAGVTFRIEAPLISFDASYSDPEEGVKSLFSTLTSASAGISGKEAAIEAAGVEIKRLEAEIEWMREEITDLSEMSVASDMLADYEEMAIKCAQIMNGDGISGWLEALVIKHGPVVQASVGVSKRGKVVPSFAWWLWRK